MKVVILSGDPSNQEALIKSLLAASVDNGQEVHLHNALHSEMSVVNKMIPMSEDTKDSISTRFYNEEVGVCLSTLYRSPFVGHNIGYSYNCFNKDQKELLEKIVVLSKFKGTEHYWPLFTNVKDVKYVDTLIIYNVIRHDGLMPIITKSNNAYGRSTNTFFWLHYPGTCTYDCIKETEQEQLKNISNLNICFDTPSDYTKYIESIIKNTSFTVKEVKEAPDGELPTPEPVYRWITNPYIEDTIRNTARDYVNGLAFGYSVGRVQN